MPNSEVKIDHKKGDQVLKRMLKTPPKTHDEQKPKESHDKKEKPGN
jgi:hypothetical protein